MENFNGRIIELRLLKEIGYGYIRLIDSSFVLSYDFATCILVEVLDCYSDTGYCEKDIDKIISSFKSHNFLINPLQMSHLPSVQKKEPVWKDIGELEVDGNYVIPSYRSCKDTTLFKPEKFSDYEWSITHDLGFKPSTITKYDECKHLGINETSSPDLIRFRITMEWMKYNNLKIKDFFTREEFYANYWYEILYYRTQYSSPKFSQS